MAYLQPCLNPTEREPANSEEEGTQPTIADNEGMHSDGKWLPPNVVINNRSKRQRAEAALKPKAAPEPVETLRGLGSMKYIRVCMPFDAAPAYLAANPSRHPVFMSIPIIVFPARI